MSAIAGHYAALGYLAAGEASGDTGVHLTRGAERLAREDAERRAYLADAMRRCRFCGAVPQDGRKNPVPGLCGANACRRKYGLSGEP